jgi:hypothetical protein
MSQAACGLLGVLLVGSLGSLRAVEATWYVIPAEVFE